MAYITEIFGGASYVWASRVCQGEVYNGALGYWQERTALPTPSKEITLSELELYPNPTTGIINLKNLYGIESLRLLNLNGKILYERMLKAQQAQLELNLANYKQGVYLLELASGQAIEIRKVIVQ